MNNILLNVIVGVYLPSIFGWIFLLLIITIEGIVMSVLLNKVYWHRKIFINICVTNIISTVVGFFIFSHNNEGGYLLNWISIIKYSNSGMETENIVLSLAPPFLITNLAEGLYNVIVFKEDYEITEIIKNTFWVNFITYIIAFFILIIWRFAVVDV